MTTTTTRWQRSLVRWRETMMTAMTRQGWLSRLPRPGRLPRRQAARLGCVSTSPTVVWLRSFQTRKRFARASSSRWMSAVRCSSMQSMMGGMEGRRAFRPRWQAPLTTRRLDPRARQSEDTSPQTAAAAARPSHTPFVWTVVCRRDANLGGWLFALPEPTPHCRLSETCRAAETAEIPRTSRRDSSWWRAWDSSPRLQAHRVALLPPFSKHSFHPGSA